MKRCLPAIAVTGALVALALPPIAASAATSREARGPLPARLVGVHDARQVISVINAGYGETTATVQAFARDGNTWRLVFGPWAANIGYAGFAPIGEKREGDGRTPSGSYPFSFFFGVEGNPGVSFPWRVAHTYDYWDDDSTSSRYNLWVDTRRHSAGRSPEPLHVLPSYRDAAVIAYNAHRVPGRGSAIFLHVTHHSATNGCISLPRSRLLALLRWLQPDDHPRIIMGTAATVTR